MILNFDIILSESCFYGFPSQSYNILGAFKWLKDHDQYQWRLYE